MRKKNVWKFTLPVLAITRQKSTQWFGKIVNRFRKTFVEKLLMVISWPGYTIKKNWSVNYAWRLWRETTIPFYSRKFNCSYHCIRARAWSDGEGEGTCRWDGKKRSLTEWKLKFIHVLRGPLFCCAFGNGISGGSERIDN